MGLSVSTPDKAARKFRERGAAAAGDYGEGVSGKGGLWQQKTAAASDNYAAGTQAAIADGRFAKGVAKAGPSKYENNAKTIGARRFGEGIANAAPAYQNAVAPFLDAMRNMDLDSVAPRRPKGDPSNYRRSEAIGMRLRAVKLGQQ